jgi:hypothetical protein
MSPDRPLTALVAVNRTYLRKLEKGASYPGLEITAKLATVGQSRSLPMRRCIGPLVRPEPTPSSERCPKR